MMYFSLLIAAFGLMIFLGDPRLIAGFNVMTEKERSTYNMKRVTFFMGALCMALSYTFFLIFLSIILFCVMIVALCILTMVISFYINAGKIFKADASGKV